MKEPASETNAFDRTLGIRIARVPPLVAAFILASLLYKLGSFALECVAFLVTWRLFDAAYAWLTRKRAGG